MEECIRKNVAFDALIELKCRESIARMATVSNEEWQKRFKEIEKEMKKEIEEKLRG